MDLADGAGVVGAACLTHWLSGELHMVGVQDLTAFLGQTGFEVHR